MRAQHSAADAGHAEQAHAVGGAGGHVRPGARHGKLRDGDARAVPLWLRRRPRHAGQHRQHPAAHQLARAPDHVAAQGAERDPARGAHHVHGPHLQSQDGPAGQTQRAGPPTVLVRTPVQLHQSLRGFVLSATRHHARGLGGHLRQGPVSRLPAAVPPPSGQGRHQRGLLHAARLHLRALGGLPGQQVLLSARGEPRRALRAQGAAEHQPVSLRRPRLRLVPALLQRRQLAAGGCRGHDADPRPPRDVLQDPAETRRHHGGQSADPAQPQSGPRSVHLLGTHVPRDRLPHHLARRGRGRADPGDPPLGVHRHDGGGLHHPVRRVLLHRGGRAHAGRRVRAHLQGRRVHGGEPGARHGGAADGQPPHHQRRVARRARRHAPVARAAPRPRAPRAAVPPAEEHVGHLHHGVLVERLHRLHAAAVRDEQPGRPGRRDGPHDGARPRFVPRPGASRVNGLMDAAPPPSPPSGAPAPSPRPPGRPPRGPRTLAW